MELLITNVIGAFTNIIVFSIVPVLWWLIFHRKKTNFFQWVGLYKPELKSKWWMVLLFAAVYYFVYSFDITKFISAESLEVVENSDSVAANAFAGIGMDFHIVMFLFTGSAGLLLAWLDEKIYNGSIVPGILLHGLGNFIGSRRVAFGWW